MNQKKEREGDLRYTETLSKTKSKEVWWLIPARYSEIPMVTSTKMYLNVVAVEV